MVSETLSTTDPGVKFEASSDAVGTITQTQSAHCLLYTSDLDSKNLEEVTIPDYVEVTADVKDFSLDMTMTFVMSDILQELDVDQDLSLIHI